MNTNANQQVALYTTSDCGQCVATRLGLNARGIEYDEIDLAEDDDAYQFVTKDLGYKSVPVVVVNDEVHWSGFRPDLLDQLEERGTIMPPTESSVAKELPYGVVALYPDERGQISELLAHEMTFYETLSHTIVSDSLANIWNRHQGQLRAAASRGSERIFDKHAQMYVDEIVDWADEHQIVAPKLEESLEMLRKPTKTERRVKPDTVTNPSTHTSAQSTSLMHRQHQHASTLMQARSY